ncbi:MAG: 4Fe-4S binding protein [Candidatus Eremiobacteraeota bacterium]|nr:4Fe-4S binding protein [Candidatus Eremiobacteraeota bacterium]
MGTRKKGLFKMRTLTALFSTAALYLGALGIKFRKICSPGFTCHGCPWATFACPVGVTSFTLALGRFPFLALGSVFLVGAFVGRHVCGFICPFGLLQDLIAKIPVKKLRLPKALRLVKYGALALLVFLFPLLLGFKPSGYLQIEKAAIQQKDDGTLQAAVTVKNLGKAPVENPSLTFTFMEKGNTKVQQIFSRSFDGVSVAPGETRDLPAPVLPDRLAEADITIESPQSIAGQSPLVPLLYYCKICPNGTLTATLPSYSVKGGIQNSMYRGHVTRFLILGLFLVLMVFISRPFCRTFCPLGALYALTSRLALIRLTFDQDACVNCGICDKACPVELDVRKEIGGAECIACGDCIAACPKSALRRKAGL